jgi:toxin FitB
LYNNRILQFSVEIADIWGRMIANHKHHLIDAQLAATAYHHDLILVTRNVADIERCGVRFVNPWQGNP